MANNDIEMEDTQKPDLGTGIKECDDKVLESKSELKGNEVPSAVAIGENANQSENGDGDVNKLSDEAKDQIPAVNEVETQNSNETKTDEPMSVEGVEITGEQNDSDSKNEERITEANAEVQTASGSIVDKIADVKDEVVQETDASDGPKEENPIGNVVKSEIPVKSVEGNSNDDVAVEKPKDSGEKEECVKNVVTMANENADIGGNSSENNKLQTEPSSNEVPQVQSVTSVEEPQNEDEEMQDAAVVNEGKAVNENEDKAVNDEPKQEGKEILPAGPTTDQKAKSVDSETRLEPNDSFNPNQHEAATPNSVMRYLPANSGNHSGETDKTFYNHSALPLMAEGDDGTPEDQAAFIRELESFYRGRAMDFKPPKFYGQPLNCLKLWRAVIRLGGYDRVTGSKLWRQVGESFHPPKTCTTVSWTFRIFYEKSLLEYERHKRQSGDLQLPIAMLPEASDPDIEGNGYQGSGSGRARRDAAARAMQGWHVQRLFNIGEVGEPVSKDKNINNTVKREKNIKSIASLKQKRPNEVDHPVKAARTEISKQIDTSVIDSGAAADWVKINVRQAKDCFEVYALVPGLLREEVRVQSDPAGRLVITGLPEQVDNPWGITPFRKIVNLPARIDPLETSAVVSLHGRLFVRVPFESNS